jgi:hypothetical protein
VSTFLVLRAPLPAALAGRVMAARLIRVRVAQFNWEQPVNKPLIAALLVVCFGSLTGCGSDPTPVLVKTDNTCGKQLSDLKNALDAGAMSPPEYDKARKEALRHCDNK